MNAVAPVSARSSGAALAVQFSDWAALSMSVQSSNGVKGVDASGQLASVEKINSSTAQGVPVSLLMSVSRPTGNNMRANLDYEALKEAMGSGNLTAAQQAYVRLQTDLLLATGGNAATGGNQLNATA